ncbi:hypothetical protein QYE76_015447 [Lolium multiflorum]|uniref:Retrotransposon gag domain-containing protein n=1 Tax=Lolium multiflorum TaxID=4521 RepID=A0AAD8X7R7_LOLMU|nr:hypothetical protein QYE76_015447 [Lolium multiflorum]
MAEETPVTYEDLNGELKKKYDEVKVLLEADLIGSFHRTRSHGIRWKGFSPEGALDGVDLSTPSEERTRSLRQEINFMVAHSLHRHSESLVNTLERVALRVIQEIMSHQYSPSGPALGTHQGELPLQSRPPLPFALAAPEAPNSSAYVVYKIGGDPSDYQFLHDAPKEIPHGYACAYVPDCSTWALSNQVATAGTSGTTGGTSEADPEKQTWLAKYATPTKLRAQLLQLAQNRKNKHGWLNQFGMMPKRKTIGYTKPYPNEYELIPLPPKYRLPDFTKFSGSDGSSSIEHSLTGSAFGWYTSLPPNSVQTWKQLEERFHEQYHSEASEAGIADLAQVRQKRGETVSEYIQRFRTVRNRCYSVHVSEKEAVELAVVGLSSSIKDVASQADYPSLAHMVQKLSAYEQRHPDVYQDKFKRVVTMVDAGEDEGATGEQEVAVAEWTRAAGPVTCKWVKPPGPPRGFDFDVTKTEQIFDLLLAEKHIKIPEGHKVPTVQELNGKPYCKWHNTFTHTTNDCRVWRQQIQMAIENGRLIFNQYAMKVDTHPFPAVNMVEFTHLGGCQPDFSANINMVELGHHLRDGMRAAALRAKTQRRPLHGFRQCQDCRLGGSRGQVDLEGLGEKTILLWLLFLPFPRMEKSKNKLSLPKTIKVLLFMKVKSQPMIKDLLRIGAQFVGYREYANKTEEKLVEANERANTLAQQLEHSEKARKKAELDATEARAEADKAKADAAGVEDLRKRLHTAETSLSDHIAAQSAREEAILKRLRTQSRRFVARTAQEFQLEEPANDPLLDALSFLEVHGSEAREGIDQAKAGLSRLFPYFFPKKEEPATFLNLAKSFNSSEDLGLKMRQENMKVAVESTVALVADSQQTIDWMKLIFDNYSSIPGPPEVFPSSLAKKSSVPVNLDDSSSMDLTEELKELRVQLQSVKKQSLILMEQSRESSQREKIALQQAQDAIAEKDAAVAEAAAATSRENSMLQLLTDASLDMAGIWLGNPCLLVFNSVCSSFDYFCDDVGSKPW